MASGHALRRALARMTGRLRVVAAKWRAAGGLPEPSAEPDTIARVLMACARAGMHRSVHDALDALCREALAHQPGHETLTAAAARWYLATGRPDEARLVCEEAFGHNAAGVAHDHAVQSVWGEALLILNREREAVWRLEAACAAEGVTAEDWAHFAWACCRTGRYEQALEAGQKTLGRSWTRPETIDSAALAMATAHYCLGRMDEAERLLVDLLSRVPHHADARRLLSKVRNFMGKGMQHET